VVKNQRRSQLRVIRVDIAMSALTSAIHNTGHYDVRLVTRFLRPLCKQWAQPPQLLRPGIARFGDTSRTCGRQRLGMSTAANLRETCCRDTDRSFCWIVVWRGIAQGRRGADRRPGDGKIKGARCAPVGEWKKAIGSARCNEARFWLAACDLAQAYARSWSPAPRRLRRAMPLGASRCQAAASPSRLALRAPGSAGLRP